MEIEITVNTLSYHTDIFRGLVDASLCVVTIGCRPHGLVAAARLLQ